MAKSISIRDLAVGFALGAAAATLLPLFLGGKDEGKREVVKAGLKRTVRAFEGSTEKLAELRENVEDLLAEVSAEMAEEARQTDVKATDRSEAG